MIIKGVVQKNLTTTLLEYLAKINGVALNLKTVHLNNIGSLNANAVCQFVQNIYSNTAYDLETCDGALLTLLSSNLSDSLKKNNGLDIYFPNLRPVNHFAEGEEVYAMVSDFSSAKQDDYKELGFIKTVIETKPEVSIYLKIKTFDNLPDGHYLSTGNSSGHCSTNYGRLLKIKEFDILKEAATSNPEFVELFRANSVGSFKNLDLYDIKKYSAVKKVDLTYSHNEM